MVEAGEEGIDPEEERRFAQVPEVRPDELGRQDVVAECTPKVLWQTNPAATWIFGLNQTDEYFAPNSLFSALSLVQS